MSKHREILPEVIKRLAAVDPGCGVVVIGSVQYGYERPDSDLDLLAVVHEAAANGLSDWKVAWESRGVRELETEIKKILVQVFFAPVSGLERWLTETPYFMYPFSQGELLHDPQGLAAHYQLSARKYFEERPAVASEWSAQLQAHKQVKLTGRDKEGFYRTETGELKKYLSLGEFCSRIAEVAAASF